MRGALLLRQEFGSVLFSVLFKARLPQRSAAMTKVAELEARVY